MFALSGIDVHCLDAMVCGMDTFRRESERSVAITRLAERIREDTGVSWPYACWLAERAFMELEAHDAR